jgi:hypothetical protein
VVVFLSERRMARNSITDVMAPWSLSSVRVETWSV